MRRTFTFISIFALMMSMLAWPALAEGDSPTPPEPTYTEDWDGRGDDSEDCKKVFDEDGVIDESDPRYEFALQGGWIHWIFNTKGASTDAELVLGGSGVGTYEPGPPLTANVWHFYTPYFELDQLTATINLFGGDPGAGGGLVISDYCSEFVLEGVLTVEKTAVTSFTREHFWEIDKKVETENEEFVNGTPKIWLYTDGSGNETATWTVDVTYEGYEDSDWNVSGTITIANTGALPTTIDSVVDELAGEAIDVDCDVDFPYVLAVGGELVCTYSEDGFVEGSNEVTVTTSLGTVYEADADIIWGDPTTELNDAVRVVDRYFNGESEEVRRWDINAADYDEGDVESFSYDIAYAYADFDECGAYTFSNRARVRVAGGDILTDWATADLKVNVQCLVRKGETVTGAGLPWSEFGVRTWFEYSPLLHETGSRDDFEDGKVKLIQGPRRNHAGHAYLDQVKGEMCFVFADGWGFDLTVAGNVKIEPLQVRPTAWLAPGQFSEHTSITEDDVFCVDVGEAAYGYAIHLDALSPTLIPDPNFGP